MGLGARKIYGATFTNWPQENGNGEIVVCPANSYLLPACAAEPRYSRTWELGTPKGL